MRRRLLLSYVSITIFVLLTLEIPLGVSFARAERRRLETDVQHDALALAIRSEEAFEQETGPGSDLEMLADRYQDDIGGRVVVVDARGDVVADSDPPRESEETRNFASRPEIAAALRGEERTGSRHSDTLGIDLLYVAVPVSSSDHLLGAVRVTYPLSVVDDRIRRNWLLLAATGGVVLVVVFAVSVLLARSFSRPLGELRQAAERLGDGDLTARVRVPPAPPEARVLAERFNATAVRLEQLVASQQAFVADASHQLRTPLAALRLRLENLEAEVSDDAADDLEGAIAEVQRLSRLVDGLLLLARAEEAGSSPRNVEVAEVVDGRRDAWSALAAERGVRIVTDVERGLWARVTPGRLEQVLDNLLNNALEVAPTGTGVALTAAAHDGRVELRVADAGPGMTDDERARAFDRFWRARRAGGDGTGFGLGLAIVRQLVRADGGEVELASSGDGGLEVVVRLRPSGGGSPVV